jgi:hypothetical protein
VSSQPCDDVATLLKLYELATAPHVRDAQAWALTELQATDYETFQRRYPIGSAEWRRFTDICGIMELFGVLVKHSLVREEVFFDLFGGIDILWEAVAGVIPGMRQAIAPRLYENFEALYQRAKERN